LNRWTQEGVEQGIKYLERAVERDPGYALAYTAMALAYTLLGIGIAGALPPEQAYPRARTAVAKALELDSELAEAHAMLGFLRYVCDYDWVGAEKELRWAIELNPNSGAAYDNLGLMLAAMERYDEALEVQLRAHELDPLAYRLDPATTFLRAGRYSEALEIAIRVTQIDPHSALARATLGWAYLYNGSAEQGLAELEKAVALAPDSTMFLAQLGQYLGRVGKTAEAREILRQLKQLSEERYVSPYHMAYVHAGLGEDEEAIDWLECAYSEGAGGVWGIKGSFLFTTLRSHPRFQALLKKMKLA
jgi:tetratricopeptide (TPR) repeat protein